MAARTVTGPWRLVMPRAIYERLKTHLFPGDGDEHGAVICAGVARLPSGETRLLARNLFLAKDGTDYVPGQRGYRMLKAEFVRDRIKFCRDERLVYLAVHNHGPGDTVCFSSDDIRSHERGYPALLDIARGMPVGALVFASDAIAGDIWLPDGRRVELAGATIVGTRQTLLTAKPNIQNQNSNPKYHRQSLLFGHIGQAMLSRTRVGVLGLGGVGSLIAEYLAHLGVGHFVLIDPDRMDITNRPRIVGATGWDARTFLLTVNFLPPWVRRFAKATATPKVDISSRVIKRANPSANIQRIRADIQSPEATAALLTCDYLFLAADTMRARLVFNQMVQQYFIPGVQVGSKITTDQATGTVTNVFSIVRPVSPGCGCLWCNQLIDPVKLQEEAQTAAERISQRYLDEPEVSAPSVITLNAVGAAHAVNDFLFYLMGLTKPDTSSSYMRHMPADRRTWLDEPRRDDRCTECSATTKSRFGRGDEVSLTL